MWKYMFINCTLLYKRGISLYFYSSIPQDKKKGKNYNDTQRSGSAKEDKQSKANN